MLLAIALILFIAWLLGIFTLHITGSVFHLLVILAVIALIVHLLRRPRMI